MFGQSTSFQNLAVICHCKQEGLQPSHVTLFNDASSLALKVLLPCNDLSPKGEFVFEKDLDDALESLGIHRGCCF